MFLRLDDVSTLDARLVYLVENALGHQIPLLLAVVPAELTTEAAQWLMHLQAAYPILDIGQHGYRHEGFDCRNGRGEFCRTRTASEQNRDIDEGAAIMDNAFGSHWQQIFVPPFNCMNRTTARLLIRKGYIGVSTFYLPIKNVKQFYSFVIGGMSYYFGGHLTHFRNGYRVEGQLPCISPALDTVKNYGSFSS